MEILIIALIIIYATFYMVYYVYTVRDWEKERKRKAELYDRWMDDTTGTVPYPYDR